MLKVEIRDKKLDSINFEILFLKKIKLIFLNFILIFNNSFF